MKWSILQKCQTIMKVFKVLNSILMTARQAIQLEHDFLLNIHQYFTSQDFTNQQVVRLLQIQLIFSSDFFLINYCDWLIDYCWPGRKLLLVWGWCWDPSFTQITGWTDSTEQSRAGLCHTPTLYNCTHRQHYCTHVLCLHLYISHMILARDGWQHAVHTD